MKRLRLLLLSSILSVGSLCGVAQYSVEIVSELGYGSGNFSFLNENIGYHFSGLGISKTIDGGDTWDEFIPNIQPLTNPDAFYLSGQFVNESTGYAVLLRYDNDDHIRDSSFLYKTTDGGSSWELNTINPPNETPFGAASFSKVYFKNELQGWLFGKGLLLHTTDGGDNWTTLIHNEDHPSNNDVMRGMCFSNDNTAYIAGYGAWIQQSEDDGFTWEDQHYVEEIGVSDDYYMYDVDFANSDVGYVGVGHGILKKTINGGDDWVEIYTGFPDDVNSVFVDEFNTVWCGTGDYCDDTGCYYTSSLIYSADGGETWVTMCNEGSSAKFTDVVWPSDSYGLACTDDGTIFKLSRGDASLDNPSVTRTSLYPNPSSDYIKVDNSGSFDHAKIINPKGQILINSKSSTVSVQSLAPGIYWANVYDANENIISSEKFTKH